MGMIDEVEATAMFCHEMLQKFGPRGFSNLNAWIHEIGNINQSTKLNAYEVAKWAWDSEFWQIRITSPLFMRRNWAEIEAQYSKATISERRKNTIVNSGPLKSQQPITNLDKEAEQPTTSQPVHRCLFVDNHCRFVFGKACNFGCLPPDEIAIARNRAKSACEAFSAPHPGQVPSTPCIQGKS